MPAWRNGTATLKMPTQLWGAEANLRRELCRTTCMHLDLIGGFRYLDLDEGLELTDLSPRSSTRAPGP